MNRHGYSPVSTTWTGGRLGLLQGGQSGPLQPFRENRFRPTAPCANWRGTTTNVPLITGASKVLLFPDGNRPSAAACADERRAGNGEFGVGGENVTRFMETKQFRFEDLEIWRRAADVTLRLFDMADALDSARKYRFAEQLRSAALSMTNNIAEGSGSSSASDFSNFLNMARRSLFEVASMLKMFSRANLIDAPAAEFVLAELAEQSRMIVCFRRALNK